MLTRKKLFSAAACSLRPAVSFEDRGKSAEAECRADLDGLRGLRARHAGRQLVVPKVRHHDQHRLLQQQPESMPSIAQEVHRLIPAFTWLATMELRP